MIDFHSHILPNIDDGARDVEETFKLIEEAEKAGFTTVISTSHYIEGYYESDVNERKIWIDAINKNLEIKKRNIQIKLGNEVYFTNNIEELLKENKITTIDGTKYLLFEMPLDTKPMNMYDVIYNILQQKKVPILAHPERYTYIQKETKIVSDLIEKGVLMQANYGSIIGQYQEKAKVIVKKLLENDMIHFLGSDVHRKKTIYSKIPEILEIIEKIIGKEKLEEITTKNPQKVLNNEEIEIKEPIEIKLNLKEKLKLHLVI